MKVDELVNTVLDLTRKDTIVEVRGKDDRLYAVRPFIWTVDAIEHYSAIFARYQTLSDDIGKDQISFFKFVTAPSTLWFEVIDVKSMQNVGFIYLSDMLRSGVEDRFISATFHAITWDAKAGRRLELAQKFIQHLFKTFRLHRLTAAIPLRFGGAIRIAKRLGFKEDGVLRSARRYNGEWFGVLVLSIIENEVDHG